MYKSKQFPSDEDVPLVEERTITHKNNLNIKETDTEFVCETCGLTLANKNDLMIHLKMHNGNE
jgi:Zn finger protein HypA/HybF involved in hydrogenase expression